jgi:hypothetical protein
MGNRSKFVVVSAAAATAAALAARRRARLRRAAENIQDAIMPTRGDWPFLDEKPIADEAHARGHRHLTLEARPHGVLEHPAFEHRRAGHGHPFSS